MDRKDCAAIVLYYCSHIAATDSALIVRLDMDERYGWEPKWVWDWIDARRGVRRNYLAEILALMPPGDTTGSGNLGGQKP